MRRAKRLVGINGKWSVTGREANERVETRVYGDRWMVFDQQRLVEGETIIIGVDITQNKKNEMVLREAKMAADAANNAKSQFLANMSHELRTPLNAIIGFSEIIHDEVFGPLGNARYKSYSADIRNSAEHLFGIIADLLDMSRIEAGRMETEPESFRAVGAIQEVVRMVAGQADEAQLDLKARTSGEGPMVYSDRRMLIQMLINLLSNSIKFTDAGGQVELFAEAEEEMVCLRGPRQWHRNSRGRLCPGPEALRAGRAGDQGAISAGNRIGASPQRLARGTERRFAVAQE